MSKQSSLLKACPEQAQIRLLCFQKWRWVPVPLDLEDELVNGPVWDIVLDSRYEIKKMGGDLVEIGFVGKMEFGELLSKVTGNNPMKMRLTKAEIKGTYAVHLKRPQVIGTMHFPHGDGTSVGWRTRRSHEYDHNCIDA